MGSLTDMRPIIAFILALPLSAAAQEAAAPLPDLESFLQGVRRTLRSDRLLLSQYTFQERIVVLEKEKDGRVKKTREQVYEVYPHMENKLTFRKLVSRDGKALRPDELAKQEREHDKKLADYTRKAGRETPKTREARAAEEQKKEDEILDEAFRLFDVRMLGREARDGVATIRLAFAPRPGYRPRSREAKILANMAGEGWFCESDHQLVRLEIRLLENFSMGLGLIARVEKGSQLTFQRRRVNDEIWLPAQAHFLGRGRMLVFKGFNLDVTTEVFDCRRFTVESSVSFGQGRKP